MELWEQLLIGVLAVGVLFYFGPGVKRAIERSKQVEERDWKGFMLPIGLVVLLVILLLAMV